MTTIRRTIAATALALLLAPAAATASTTDATEDAQLLLLLDSSGSMADPDADGEPEVDAAKAAVSTLVDGLDPGQRVGVRLFGAEVPLDQPTEAKCTDSSLAVPIGADNTDELTAAIEGYEPLGETPIGYALQQAAADLGETGNRTVLLVSDGIATCDPDPCEVAEELAADGFDLVVHTVGLGVDDETRSQLECVAAAAGGTYYDADDADSLTTALTRVSTRAFRPFQLSGEPVQGTESPLDAPTLREGQYLGTVGEQPLHYRVRRSVIDSTLHVGVTIRPEDDAGMSALNLALETLDGDSCDFSVLMVWSAASGNNFGSGSVNGTPQAHREGCGNDEELVLRVEQQNTSEVTGELIEITVLEEAPVLDPESLPDEDTEPTWQGPTSGTPSETVAGGTSFNDATPIVPGQTYDSDILPGEVRVFSVPVDWGQHLETLVTFPPPQESRPNERVPAGGMVVDVLIAGPDRGDAAAHTADIPDLSSRAPLSERQTTQVADASYTVQWRNREDLTSSQAERAGDYFVIVTLTSNEPWSVPVPFRLVADAVGEVGGVPTYLEAGQVAAGEPSQDGAAQTGQGSADPDEVQESGAGDAGAAASAEPDEDSLPTLVWVLAGAGLVIALAGAFLLLRGRRIDP